MNVSVPIGDLRGTTFVVDLVVTVLGLQVAVTGTVAIEATKAKTPPSALELA